MMNGVTPGHDVKNLNGEKLPWRELLLPTENYPTNASAYLLGTANCHLVELCTNLQYQILVIGILKETIVRLPWYILPLSHKVFFLSWLGTFPE
jgi:hypothetical protein